ncbi:hypothetical protein ACIO52_10195 [Nocardia sp. NPDC087230]|uniref:hypothetical protein n=1 Tax=Nocardia sp. NPDC087230 TaxID=3364331 RepID=UPI003810904A
MSHPSGHGPNEGVAQQFSPLSAPAVLSGPDHRASGAGNGEWWLSPRADPYSVPQAVQPWQDAGRVRQGVAPVPRLERRRRPDASGVPLHRTMGTLALLLAVLSAIAAINGFLWAAAPHAGSGTSEQISSEAGGNVVFVLLWGIGGLLLAQQIGYSRALVFALAAIYLSQYAEGMDVLTADGNQLEPWIAWSGLLLALPLTALLPISAAATWTRRRKGDAHESATRS